MHTNLKRFQVIALTLLALTGTVDASATAAELELVRRPLARDHYRSARLVVPVMIGGFALGAHTYTYRSTAFPWYFNNYWLRSCTPHPVIAGFTAGGREIVRLIGACP